MQTRLARLYQKGDLRVETDTVPAPGPGEVLLKMAAAGICGSDLHYYQDGGFGPVRVREPIIPGHEASGRVSRAGEGVELKAGTLVAVNPSQPCGHCEYCGKGLPIHCLDMRFMGSAMRLPHEQGMFRDWLVVPPANVSKWEPRRQPPKPPAASRSPSACMPHRAPARYRANASSSPAPARSAA